ncbi:hypothetical protein BCR33DRAFT_788917 [Rhizoclosmatium globosum]|uniref:Uncharacterized protein n=1 Tax=Rhizoclosmatium globosum TaxID=329046 RepID=A0A1Y2BU93_9FUNG|nr:hypothetical protein BCR33DRAFT_788917 [Rhizoclosmatium globosum]|eukprot:ORY38332.1 hypothetical protein BCR33DRAFT_788917 [Rhizoclosmatium globosum]
MNAQSAIDKVNQINYSMGMVSFATVLFMLHTDSYQIDWRPPSWVRIMIYLDALAFFIYYLGGLIQDSGSCQMYYWVLVASEVVWSFKDAFKFGYIVFRGLAIVGNKRIYPFLITPLISLALYWHYIYVVYGEILISPCECAPEEEIFGS